jgi:putative transposase
MCKYLADKFPKGLIALHLTRPVICKVQADRKDYDSLVHTVDAFQSACNYISRIAFQKRCFDPIALHALVYQKVRAIFKLPANLAIQARNRVAESYRLHRDRLHTFSKNSMALDDRLFSLLRSRDFAVSIATIKGRVKPKLVLGEYQRTVLQKPVKSARLILRKAGLFLKILVAYDVPPKDATEPVGVDVGIRKLLVGSNGFAAGGGPFMARMEHFESLLQTLGTKGTSSSKRRQKRLAGKEKRWANAMLHQISRRFVESLKEEEYVVLEELPDAGKSNIVKPCKDHPAAFRGWAISRLLHMLSYKCANAGVPVVYVSPDFTSQRCPRCGTIHKNNRRTQALFRCVNCCFQHNADTVAALNLREQARGGWAAVSQPNAVHKGMDRQPHV